MNHTSFSIITIINFYKTSNVFNNLKSETLLFVFLTLKYIFVSLCRISKNSFLEIPIRKQYLLSKSFIIIMKKYLLLFFVPISLFGLAQEEKKFGIELHGFIKTDIFYDSRQTVDIREGHFLLYPQNELLDYEDNDINATPKFNILSIQTRLTGKITGPNAFGAKTSGLIEGAFFGNINPNINVSRLRHAFVKLTWDKAELLVGQFWHPMFITSAYPGTVSFNTGAPFQPFTRNPQIRFTKKVWDLSISGTLIEQVDFVSTGPDGASPKYLINSCIPEINLLIGYESDNLLIGVGGNYKSLMPRLYLEPAANDTLSIPVKVKTNEKVSGFSTFAYLKLKTDPVSISLYGILGQMMYSMTGIGGYAEKAFIYESISDTVYSRRLQNITYSPIGTLSAWTDIQTNGDTWQFGLFAGYTKNMGASDALADKIYGRGSNINYIYRISPRVIYTNGIIRIAPEIEYTVAAYATKDETEKPNIDSKGVVTDSKEIANFRFLLGVYYMF